MSAGKVSPYPVALEPDDQNPKKNPMDQPLSVPPGYPCPSDLADPVLPESSNFSPNFQTENTRADQLKIFYPKKRLCKAYFMWFPFGILGAHHFYLRRYEFGFLYLFSGGLCGIGWIVDAFRMRQLVDEANKKMEHPEVDYPLNVWDAYAMWFPFGIFGLHHFYMMRVNWGVTYSWTLGLYGIGWLIDAFRMPSLVRQANIDRPSQRLWEAQPRNAELSTAYVLGLTPIGLFGTHHFYLGQWRYGLFYMYTLGGAGIGWIMDWFRMHWLVKRVNDPSKYPLGNRQKHIDSAYICAIPFGLLGGHHFYLGNPKLGTLYFFTIGLFSVGWIIDLFIMPCLVKKANARLIEEQKLIACIRASQCQGPVTVPGSLVNQPNAFFNPTSDGQNQPPAAQPPSYSEAVSHQYIAVTSHRFDLDIYPPPLRFVAIPGSSDTGPHQSAPKNPMSWYGN